ncbi:unnamed protein product [Amoebophrya sp. A25]|nr:unnamed protein product [Amoebophrya sp. A25]|eukprot:GSA25T00007280001.1
MVTMMIMLQRGLQQCPGFRTGVMRQDVGTLLVLIDNSCGAGARAGAPTCN